MTTPTIGQALAAVMSEVQAVGKTGYNENQRYNFRGIDAVVNAVGPAFRNHGVVCLPDVLDATYRDVQTSNGKPAREVTVRVAYTFHGPAGDSLRCVSAGESLDSGDKGTAKAMSVAYRVALLQALCIPTDEADPDSQSYERAIPANNVGSLRAAIAETGRQMGWDRAKIEADFTEWSQGQFIADINDEATLTAYRDYIDAERRRGVREHKQLVAEVHQTTQAGKQRKDSTDRGRVERSDSTSDEDPFHVTDGDGDAA